MAVTRQILRATPATVLAFLAGVALVASAAVAIADMGNGSCTPGMSPGVSPPQSPGVSPPVSPGVSPPQSPPLSPGLSPPMSPPQCPPCPMSPPQSPPQSPGVSPPQSPPLSPPLSPPACPPISPPISPPANAAPVGVDDAYNLRKKVDLVVDAPGVLANDTDADSEELAAVLVTAPAHGTLVLDADGSFVYDPDAKNPVDDSFTYRPFDGVSFGNVVTVTLNGSRGRPRS